MILDDRSIRRLVGVHHDLVAVIKEAAANADDESFVVTEGPRTFIRQLELFNAKKSQTMKSRHLTGHAVDLAVWYDKDADKVVDADELSWKFADYQKLAALIKETAAHLGIPIVWGGDWTTLKDGPHFELDRKVYP